MEKLKNILWKAKNGLTEHKRVSLAVTLVILVAAVAATAAVVLGGSRSGASVVVGGETTNDVKEPIVMYHSDSIDEAEDIELAEEEVKEEEVKEEDNSLEFEYDGKVININASSPVELIPEEELEKKVEADPGDTTIGAEVPVEDPAPSQTKETNTNTNNNGSDNKGSQDTSKNEISNEDIAITKSAYAGDQFAPFSSDIVNSFGGGYTNPKSLTVKNSSGTVVKSYSADELASYGAKLDSLSFALNSADTYTLHYEYEAPKVQVDKAIPGIDVSHWQNDIDWRAVAADGYKYAMIKVAGRSIGEDGNLYEDDYFRQNIEGALANGLQVGVYFFSQALTVQEAYEEASYILNLIKGYNITYPVAFDWETTSGYRTCDKLSRSELTAICEAFCDTVKSHGYKPMIYMSKNDWLNKVDTNRLSSKYNVWLAWYFRKYYYSDENRLYRDGDEVPDLPFEYNIWQYTSTGHVEGVGGYCDMNVTFTKAFVDGDKSKNVKLVVTDKPTQQETQTQPSTTQPSTTQPAETSKPTETTQAAPTTVQATPTTVQAASTTAKVSSTTDGQQ